MDAIVVRDLRKAYGDNVAVDGISFSVKAGEVFAIVGPNGAGKTSTVEILEGHRQRSSGEVSVLGMDPATGGRALRERIGIVLQEAGMDEEFTVRELVALYATFYPAPRTVDEVIELVGLAEKRDARSKTLSGGQRRRLDLALGLIGDPELIFLDEPTTGFDPSARRRAWELVANLCDLGTTVLLTTHYLEEARYLADRVAVIAGGELVALGTPGELAGDVAGATATIRFSLPTRVVPSDLPDVGTKVIQAGADIEVATVAPTADLQLLTGWAIERGLELDGLQIAPPDFEEVYLALVGHAAAADEEARVDA